MDTTEKLPRRISVSPSKVDWIRRATRVISMVHELHKAGYQRLRIQGRRPLRPLLAHDFAAWCVVQFGPPVAGAGTRRSRGRTGL